MNAILWLLQFMMTILLLSTAFLHGVAHAISLVDQKGLINKYRYRRSEGIKAGTAAIAVGICALSTSFGLLLSIYRMDWGFLNPSLPMMISVFYSMVLPPIGVTAFIGVVMLKGVFELVQKRASSGKPDPGRLEPPTRQPLDIDLEIYVWEKLRKLVLTTHIHYVSEVGGIIGGLPAGIVMGGMYMLVVGTTQSIAVDPKYLQDFTNTFF